MFREALAATTVTRKRRPMLIALVASLPALLALPALAAAETVTIGSPLSPAEPPVSAICANQCTVAQTAEVGATVTSPVDGSVVSWKYRSADKGAEYQLEVLNPSGKPVEVRSRSAPVTVPDSEDTVKTVTLEPALSIRKGDLIALHLITGAGVPVASSLLAEDTFAYFFPDAGQEEHTSTNQQLMLQATIVPEAGSGGGGGGGGGGTTGGGGSGGAGGTPAPPTPVLAQTPTPATAPGSLILNAAGSAVPAGTSVSSYTFKVGPEGSPINCPAQDPVLNTLVAGNVNSTASMTITTAAGASATTTIPVSSTLGTLPRVKVTGAFGTPLARVASAHSALTQLGSVYALTSQCLPLVAPPTQPKAGSVKGVKFGESALIAEAINLNTCATPVTVGIINGLGCFTKVDAEHPLPAAEAGILCGHYRFGCTVKNLRIPPPLATPASAGSAARAHGAGLSFENDIAFDGIYYSTQPVRIDGVEIDPVNGGAIVLARAGLSETKFLRADSAYLISSDAVVKIAGIPVNLHVPDYSAEYAKAKAAAECGQKAAEGISENHLATTNCLGSLRVPKIPELEHLIPTLDGPIDLSVSPENLGIELGEFTIPGGGAPIPLVPALPLTGSIKVNLTGLESASLGVHLELPGVLSDSTGHGLTGDTTLELSNKHGLQLNYLNIKVPSLAQLGLSRLKNLEFTYKRAVELYEGKGTLDLNDLINGEVNVGMAFEHGSFQHAHVDYTAPPGGGYPLFGPVFLTYVGADVSLNPTKFVGVANLGIGPAAISKCSTAGVQGTMTLTFGNPFSIDSTGNVQVLCANVGYSSRFHADSDGHVGFGLGIGYPIPGLGKISGELYGQAYADFARNIFEAQIDGQVAAELAIKKCESIGPIEECTPTLNFSQSAGATISIGDNNGHAVGGAGFCTHINLPIFGGVDVGAGTTDLPGAILGAASYNLPAIASHFQLLLGNCSLSPFRLLPPPAGIARARGHRAMTPPYTVHVEPGTGTEVIGIQGEGDAPKLTVTGPGGRQILAGAEGISISKSGIAVRQPSSGQTLIEIPEAAAGAWTLSSDPGSAPLKMVEAARALPRPKVIARVSGSGASRLLSYTFKPQPGLKVQFAEGVDGGETVIGTAVGRGGRIHFMPSPGSSRSRTIIAELIRGGRLSEALVVGHFGPGTIRPGRPSGLTVRHPRGGWQISFRPGANTTEHQLTVHFADGAQMLFALARGVHSITIPPAKDATRPTGIQVLPLRGATRGPPAILVSRLVRPRRH